MTNGIALPKIKGRHNTLDQLDHLCCALDCMADVDEDAPVPLCRSHLRIAFAHVLVNAEAMGAVLEPEEETAAQGPGITSGSSLTTQGFVYFVRFSDRIKIGWSGNPAARLRNVPHDEVLAIVPGTMHDERKTHAAFAHLRTTGEWFEAKPDLLDFIADLPIAA